MPTTSPPISVQRISRDHLCPLSPSRRHAQAIVAFQLAGEAVIEQDGAHRLSPGDVQLIPPGAAHRLVSARGVDSWCVSLEPGALDRDRFARLLAPLEAVARGALPRVSIPARRRDFVGTLFSELHAVGGHHEAVRAESLLALLLAEVGDHAPTGLALPAAPPDVTARALAFVAAHAFGPLSWADVARGVGRHRSHVAEVVRRDTGRSVGQWIEEVRLDEAQRRLEQTDELVEVIAERVGYGDATHFARTFKRRFGVGPRAFRRRARPKSHDGA